MELTSVNTIKTQKFQDVPDILVTHEESKCFHGQCIKQIIMPRPSCTACECGNKQTCNITNGMCYEVPVTHDSDNVDITKNSEVYNSSSDL